MFQPVIMLYASIARVLAFWLWESVLRYIYRDRKSRMTEDPPHQRVWEAVDLTQTKELLQNSNGLTDSIARTSPR